MTPGIDPRTYAYLKGMQNTRRQQRRERAWLTIGVIGAAALMAYIFIIGPIFLIAGSAR